MLAEPAYRSKPRVKKTSEEGQNTAWKKQKQTSSKSYLQNLKADLRDKNT